MPARAPRPADDEKAVGAHEVRAHGLLQSGSEETVTTSGSRHGLAAGDRASEVARAPHLDGRAVVYHVVVSAGVEVRINGIQIG